MVGMGHRPQCKNTCINFLILYVQVHLKSTTLTFSALTSYTDAGLSFFIEHSFFSIMHMLVFCSFTN